MLGPASDRRHGSGWKISNRLVLGEVGLPRLKLMTLDAVEAVRHMTEYWHYLAMDSTVVSSAIRRDGPVSTVGAC